MVWYNEGTILIVCNWDKHTTLAKTPSIDRYGRGKPIRMPMPIRILHSTSAFPREVGGEVLVGHKWCVCLWKN